MQKIIGFIRTRIIPGFGAQHRILKKINLMQSMLGEKCPSNPFTDHYLSQTTMHLTATN
jgi:hypothetical protein